MKKFFIKDLYLKLSYISIIIFAICMFFTLLSTPPRPIGESDDYMITTISLQNHFSIQILPEDIIRAKNDYSKDNANYIEDSWNKVLTGQDKIRYFGLFPDVGIYPWYMGTYSLCCIPVKVILAKMNVDQSYAFCLTNLLLYCLAMLFLVKKIDISDAEKFVICILLICSPTINYLYWPSAEIFIFSLVIFSVVFLSLKKFILAALSIAIAGTLNPTVMMFGFLIIFDFYYVLLSSKNVSFYWEVIKVNLQKEILLFLAFLPFFSTYIFNYSHFGVFNLQSLLGFSPFEPFGILERTFAYIMDLNYGFLPYFWIVMLLISLISLYLVICRHDLRVITCICAFIFTVMAYAITTHINCGMTGIARYNAWCYPILLYIIIYGFKHLNDISINKKIVIYVGCLLSAVWTLFVIIHIGIFNYDYIHFNFIAKEILNNNPSLYNPYPYTFVSRSLHVDGGYFYNEPVFYVDDLQIKKILLCKRKIMGSMHDTNNKIDNLSIILNKSNVSAGNEDMVWLKNEVGRFDNNSRGPLFSYVNIPSNRKLFMTVDSFKPSIGNQFLEGYFDNENTFRWTTDDAKVIIKNKLIRDNGLLIKFGVHQMLFAANPGKKLYLAIYINDIKSKNIALDNEGDHRIVISRDDLNRLLGSQNDIIQIYKVEIKLNGYFKPSDMHINSSDTRKMGIAMQYIGPNNNI